jgi:HAD superfamily hydrolase (TIGR01459 family)
MTPRIAGLREIADRFDAFLVDQYGVLHDGSRAFAGAADCLRELRTRGKRIAVVSNSGKRAAPNQRRLGELGFEPALFDAVATSGEVCREALAALPARSRLFVLSRDGDLSPVEGLDLRLVADPSEADAVLLAGIEPERLSRAAYAGLLAPAAARRAPMFCANPDLMMYVAGGAAFGTGVVARDYAATGAPTTMFGKPEPAIFRAALAALGDPDPARALMIGDSPAHDIAGAAAVGCGWLFVEGGVQSDEAADALPDAGGWRTARLDW